MPQPKRKQLKQQDSGSPPPAYPPQVQATEQETKAAVFTGPQQLSWSYNPWVDSKSRGWRRPWAALLLCVFFAAVAGVSLTWPNWWPTMLGWGGVGLLVLLGMCATIFLPVGYKLDGKGVTVTFLLAPSFRPWEHYRNYYFHDTGVHLTTMPQPSPLDAFRGHFLQYGRGEGRRELVEGYIAARIVRAPQPGTASHPNGGG